MSESVIFFQGGPMKLKDVEISSEILTDWNKKVLPNFDLLFFTDENKLLIDHLDSNVLVMSANKFYRNTYFNNFDTLNSYQAWQINEDVAYVCIVHPDNLITLEAPVREKLFRIQKEVNSGLIFNWDLIAEEIEHNSSLLQLFSPYIFDYKSEQYLAIQYSLWNKLSTELQHGFLMKVANDFVHDVALEDEQLQSFMNEYPHIAPYFNAFSNFNGANCFASTLAAISGSDADIDWLITKWVEAESLLYRLILNHYTLKSPSLIDLLPRDVLLWKDNNNNVIHSAFYLGNGYFFNKHGQSFFTPWQIIKLNHLTEMWGKEGIHIYRSGK